MPRYTPTGRARVYRTGTTDYYDLPLDEARKFVGMNPGWELFSIMKEDDGDR